MRQESICVLKLLGKVVFIRINEGKLKSPIL